MAEQPASISVATAAIAAVPPLLTLLFAQVRRRDGAPRRAKTLEECQRLIGFAKELIQVSATINPEPPAAIREQVDSILRSASRGACSAAAALEAEVSAGALAAKGAASEPVLLRWPKGRRAQVVTILYYYLLLTLFISPFSMAAALLQKRAEGGKFDFFDLVGGVAFMAMTGAAVWTSRRKALSLQSPTLAYAPVVSEFRS